MSDFIASPGLRRVSLVTETVKSLRQGIDDGLFGEYLPGERILCERWQISRPTLRAALQILQKEELLEVVHGHRTRVTAQQRKVAQKLLVVGLLTPEPLELMPPSALLWVDELRRQLAAAGHALHVQVGKAGFQSANPGHAMSPLLEATPASVWILYQSTEALQKWFQQSRLPCVVVGTLFPDIHLPAVDKDYRATCRHAAGLLAGRGCKRIALLIQKQRYGGDLESEKGFTEGITAASIGKVEGQIIRHDGSLKRIQSCVELLLTSRTRPDALIVARSAHALTALTVLLNHGVRIPEDMALICRDDDGFLDHVIPRLSRYKVSPAGFVKRIYRRVMNLVQNGHTTDGEGLVVPEFLKRESV